MTECSHECCGGIGCAAPDAFWKAREPADGSATQVPVRLINTYMITTRRNVSLHRM